MEQSIDWSKCPGIEVDPQRQSGAPVFAGTRIPVNVVVNNIHKGGTPSEIEEILDNFKVTREQINLVLDHLRRKEILVPERPKPLGSKRSLRLTRTSSTSKIFLNGL